MNCPQCGHGTLTKDSRVREGNRFRRRYCECGHVFSTVETLYVRQQPKKKPPKKPPAAKKPAPKKVYAPQAEQTSEWSIPLTATTPDWVRRIAERIH